jgi:hypothetical protein
MKKYIPKLGNRYLAVELELGTSVIILFEVRNKSR